MVKPMVESEGIRSVKSFCRHMAERSLYSGASFAESLALVREASVTLGGRELPDEDLATFTEHWVHYQSGVLAHDLLKDPLTGLYTWLFFGERVREIYLGGRFEEHALITCRLPESGCAWSRLGASISVAHALKQVCAPLPAAIAGSNMFVGLCRADRTERLLAELTKRIDRLATDLGGGLVEIHGLPMPATLDVLDEELMAS
jgi:hypothetical protein